MVEKNVTTHLQPLFEACGSVVKQNAHDITVAHPGAGARTLTIEPRGWS